MKTCEGCKQERTDVTNNGYCVTCVDWWFTQEKVRIHNERVEAAAELLELQSKEKELFPKRATPLPSPNCSFYQQPLLTQKKQ
jgi:hypothetical protein